MDCDHDGRCRKGLGAPGLLGRPHRPQVNPMRDRGLRGPPPPGVGGGRAPSAARQLRRRLAKGSTPCTNEVARTDEPFHVACVHLGGGAGIAYRGEEVCLRRGDVFLTYFPRPYCARPRAAVEAPRGGAPFALPRRPPDAARNSCAVLHDQPLARLWARHLGRLCPGRRAVARRRGYLRAAPVGPFWPRPLRSEASRPWLLMGGGPAPVELP